MARSVLRSRVEGRRDRADPSRRGRRFALARRLGADDRSLAKPLGALIELQRQGLVRHIGLSSVSPAPDAEGAAMARIVCVQNQYNLVQRGDDDFVDALAADGVAYVPFFPLGGFSPLRSRCCPTSRTS